MAAAIVVVNGGPGGLLGGVGSDLVRVGHIRAMKRPRRGFSVFAWVLVMLLGLFCNRAALAAQVDPREAPPRQPLEEGRQLFVAKGCAQCHAVAGSEGARIGPDLGKGDGWDDIMHFAGSLWNHTPTMLAKMEERGIERPAITPEEMSHIAAYVFFVKFRSSAGNVTRGRELFNERQCSRCHQLGGSGGTTGPRLDELKDYVSAFFLAQALWNHGPQMAAKMNEMNVERPQLEPGDVSDLVAFIRGEAAAAGPMELAYAQSGSPQAGKAIFRDKGCSSCHAVGGSGGLGPDLGKHRAQVNASAIAGALWNHGPQMWTKMKERGVSFPRMNEREMADLLAYLYFIQVMGDGGDARKGAELVAQKSCTHCHAFGGDGPAIGPDLTKSDAVRSPLLWISEMWNHAPRMQQRMREAQLPWPRFEDDEMRDLVEYVRTRSQQLH